MKKTLLVLTMLTLTASVVMAGEMPAGYTLPKPSPELERIKSLVGQWTGTSVEKGESKPVTVSYQVTSGGSAVVETIDSGTSHEMVSVYHDKGGKLTLDHYCMLGNEPELSLKSSTGGSIDLDMTPESHTLLASQMHMHSLSLAFGANEITETWTAWSPDGKAMGPCVFKLQKKA